MSSSENRPTGAAGFRFGSRPTDDTEARRFQQQRLALTAKMLLIFFALVTLTGGVLAAIAAPQYFMAIHLHPAKRLSYLVLVIWALVWWLMRGRDRPGWMLCLCDLLLVLPLALAIGYATPRVPREMNMQFTGLLIGLLVLIMRAAMVPSRPAWTAALGLVCAPPVMIGVYQAGLPPGVPVPHLVHLAAQAIWWLGITAASTFVSRTIYGLVNEVSKARRLGQYTLKEKIGAGGMGEVYRAQHALLRRPTAIKLLPPTIAGPATVTRFEREVQLTSRLSHPNTIAIYDYGRTPDGTFYYAMEYLDGVTLERLVARDGPEPPGRVVHLLSQISEALAEAHGVGLIHRDVKPANLMLCERGGIPDFIKVLDFGLVKELDPEPDATQLTATTAITGTPLYMSPETITGNVALDGRSDLYALGAVAYFLLTGTPPFQARTVVEICGHHLHTPPQPPSQRLGSPLPAELERLVLTCLAKDPADRPQSAQEVSSWLGRVHPEAPWTREQARSWWAKYHREAAPAPEV
jgi:serine/threonine-protein kinase